MKKIILIRHGETDYTSQGRYCGREDIPLNANGIREAKLLCARLKKIKVDRIYSSDSKRAFETAKIVFRHKTIRKKKELREIDFGRFSGLTFEEAKRSYPHIYKTWLNNPRGVKMPEGESVSDFAKRIRKCFKKIFDQNAGKSVALVSHGGPIRVILLGMLKKDYDKFWSIEQNTGAINIIEFKNKMPKILKINDTSHLE